MIRLKTNRFLLEKRDALPWECEDAIAVDHDANRFAVADGATEGFDSKRWARYLATAWVRHRECDATSGGDAVRKLGERLRCRHRKHNLPWYLQEKSEQGAFAAFVGLSIHPLGAWEALALGDCCLFRESAADFVAFPLSEPEDFGKRPFLVPSLVDQYPHTGEHVRLARGVSLSGDCFLLMSDAIACWYLAHGRRDEALHNRLHHFLVEDRRSDLRSLVAAEREAGRLRNDDVAILRIAVVFQ